MSSQTKHIYEVTENTGGGNVTVGGFMVDSKHVRKNHEPERVWQFMSREGELRVIVAKHLGEYEPLKDIIAELAELRYKVREVKS